jgi:hypothetical protein
LIASRFLHLLYTYLNFFVSSISSLLRPVLYIFLNLKGIWQCLSWTKFEAQAIGMDLKTLRCVIHAHCEAVRQRIQFHIGIFLSYHGMDLYREWEWVSTFNPYLKDHWSDPIQFESISIQKLRFFNPSTLYILYYLVLIEAYLNTN